MLSQEIQNIIEAAKPHGWIVEPEAKRLMGLFGMDIAAYAWVKTPAEVAPAADRLGFPLAAKVVSPQVIHKSDVGGVVIGIDTPAALSATFDRFSKIDGFMGMHVEPMARGVELIIGMVSDRQFGPVVLLGVGGITVEIYKDTAIRMAPLVEADILSMVDSLKGRALITGYRGKPAISMARLSDLMIRFSKMAMALKGEVASMDLNPVMASADGCVVADARIMLKSHGDAPASGS